MYTIGMDPSLSNWGYVVGKYTAGGFEVLTSGCIQTKIDKKAKKSKKPKNEQDLERAQVLSKGLKALLKKWKASEILIELPVGSQSSRAQTSYGICLGVFSQFNVPYTVIRNNQIKALAGKTVGEEVTKQDIIDVVKEKGYAYIFENHKVSIHEHIADAMGTILVKMKNESF